MTIASEISRLTGLRNRIRTKLAALGLGTASDDLDDCTTAIEGITGTQSITDTRTYDVAGKQYAQVSDANLVPGNIVSGTTILGVQGTANVQPPQANLQQGTMSYGGVNPPSTLYPSSGYDGFSQVTAERTDVNPVLLPANIKNGVTIMGVTGNYESSTEAKAPTLAELVTAGITSHSVNIDPTSALHLSRVTVPQITSAVDSNIVATNIKSGVSILGVTGSFDVGVSELTGTGFGGQQWNSPRYVVTIDINVPHLSSFTLVSISGYNESMTEHPAADFDGKIASFFITDPESSSPYIRCFTAHSSGRDIYMAARDASGSVTHYNHDGNTRVSIIFPTSQTLFMGNYVVSVVYKP